MATPEDSSEPGLRHDVVSPEETRETLRHATGDMADLVRTTLGPYGMDKLVMRRMQDGQMRGFASNDGGSIIEEFEGETDDPVANHVIQTTRAQESEFGDGTTTAVVLAAALVEQGLDLIDDGLQPTTVTDGFSAAAQRTLETWEETAVPLADQTSLNRDRLRTVATCAMTNGRSESWPLAPIADDVVTATLRVSDPASGSVDLSLVGTQVVPGGEASDAELLDGWIFKKERENPTTTDAQTGRILVVDEGLQPPELDDVRIDGDNAAATAASFGDREDEWYRRLASDLAQAGVVAVVAGEQTMESARLQLTHHDIALIDEVKDSRLRAIARATNGGVSSSSALTNVDELTFGTGRVESRTISGDTFHQFTNDDAGALTLLARGGSERVAGEAERRIKDGLNAVRASVMRPEALAGGGAAELAAAHDVRELAPSRDDRSQIAIEAFAEALESIPRILARNAGHNPIDALTELRSQHAAGHRGAGIAASGEIVEDTVAHDALDPLLIRTNALVRAVELATQYIRVDTIVRFEPTSAIPDQPDDENPMEMPPQ